jgi:hypothetical protein
MRMTHDEMIAVIQAAKDGKVIQYSHRSRATPRWEKCAGSSPIWDFSNYDYRVKPAPKYRPWTIAEVPVGAILISKNLANPSRSVILQENGVMVWVGARLSPYTMAGLMEKFTLEDGTPCGVLEGGDQ